MLKIVLRDVPDSEALTRAMEQAGEVLAYRYPDLVSCKLNAEPVSGEPSRYEVRVELLLPQHQLIVNRAAASAAEALKSALEAVWSAPAMTRHLRHKLAA
jgi:hypothetical protein